MTLQERNEYLSSVGEVQRETPLSQSETDAIGSHWDSLIEIMLKRGASFSEEEQRMIKKIDRILEPSKETQKKWAAEIKALKG